MSNEVDIKEILIELTDLIIYLLVVTQGSRAMKSEAYKLLDKIAKIGASNA